MDFSIKNQDLKKLEEFMTLLHKKYSMAFNSIARLPNLYASEQLLKEIKEAKNMISLIKTEDEFEKLVLENYEFNLEIQSGYLKYFTTAKDISIDEFFSTVLGDKALKIITEASKNFDYKQYWEFYLSYQDYSYRALPTDDESIREEFRKILAQLKIDILKYAEEKFNFPKNYEFDLILGQPYSHQTYFHPTNRRMEVSPNRFFVFKDENKIKINVCGVIDVLFHELVGHGRHEINSRDLPFTIQDNSINTSITSLHVHGEGVAELAKRESINFMRLFKDKYNIEDDYINQINLSRISEDSLNLLVIYQYLKLKQLEDKSIDLEKEFLSIIPNRGLYILYSTSNESPLSCLKTSTYPLGSYYLKEIISSLKKEFGEEYVKNNSSIINEAISTGVWDFRVLPKFVKLFLRSRQFRQ